MKCYRFPSWMRLSQPCSTQVFSQKTAKGQCRTIRQTHQCGIHHEATAITIKALSTASIVSRAAIVWMRKLIQLLPEGDKRSLEGANRVMKADAFTADATLDALTFCSQAMASEIVARRGIWLRAWQADLRSKNFVSAYPFQGEKLFGDALDRILVETRDKKKAMPKTICRFDRRGSNQHSFRPPSSFARSRTGDLAGHKTNTPFGRTTTIPHLEE